MCQTNNYVAGPGVRDYVDSIVRAQDEYIRRHRVGKQRAYFPFLSLHCVPVRPRHLHPRGAGRKWQSTCAAAVLVLDCSPARVPRATVIGIAFSKRISAAVQKMGRRIELVSGTESEADRQNEDR